MKSKPKKILILSSGLGHIKLGCESFSQDCFDVLSTVPFFDVTLFKGGGRASHREIILWNFPRDSQTAAWLSRLSGRDSYWIEQFSFFFSLLPYLQRNQPDIIYGSDFNLMNFLCIWKNFTSSKYKVLFYNGSLVAPIFHLRWDLVQQLAPEHLQAALAVGVPASKQTLLPHGVNISSKFEDLTCQERNNLRRKLKLPEQGSIIISVGAINKWQKRMDYVIQEVANLPEPRPFLLLLGQIESDAPEIVELANQLLKSDSFQIRTVAKEEIANYYQASDIFVLASLYEAFGLACVEAMSYGLPCLVHDYEIARYVLGETGYFADFQIRGNLTALLIRVMSESPESSKAYLRYQSVYIRFSWENLKSQYIKLFQDST